MSKNFMLLLCMLFQLMGGVVKAQEQLTVDIAWTTSAVADAPVLDAVVGYTLVFQFECKLSIERRRIEHVNPKNAHVSLFLSSIQH